MICLAVIDTNVLVSALLSSHDNAATVQVVSKIFSGEIIVLLSDKIIDEYTEVLRRKKFRFSDEVVIRLLAVIKKYGEFVTPSPMGEILPDPKDLPFYEVVMEERKSEDAYLVTGNIKHFPVKPYIVTPRQMLNIILDNNE